MLINWQKGSVKQNINRESLSLNKSLLLVSKSKRSPIDLHSGFHQFVIEGYELWLSLGSPRTATN